MECGGCGGCRLALELIKLEAGDLSVKFPGDQDRDGVGGSGEGRKRERGKNLKLDD